MMVPVGKRNGMYRMKTIQDLHHGAKVVCFWSIDVALGIVLLA
jgi:hypothetical protein